MSNENQSCGQPDNPNPCSSGQTPEVAEVASDGVVEASTASEQVSAENCDNPSGDPENCQAGDQCCQNKDK